MSERSEQGQLAVMVIGMALVVFAVAGIAVDGTRAFLYRRSLQNAADGAATAAAAQIDDASYYSGGGGAAVVDPDAAEAVAIDALARRGLDAIPAIRVRGDEVAIVLRGEIRTTFLGLIGVRSLPVAVEAVAEPLEIP